MHHLFFKRSVQTWQSTNRAGPLLSGNHHVPYRLQRLSFGLLLAVVFEVGIILTTPVLSQDSDCYYHPLTEQLWKTGLIVSRQSMRSEQNRSEKNTCCTTISSDEQLGLRGVKRTCREWMMEEHISLHIPSWISVLLHLKELLMDSLTQQGWSANH